MDVRIGKLLVGAALLTCSPISAEEGPGISGSVACAGSAEDNRKVVLAFYDEALVKLQPLSAFERHMSEDFIEHKPDVPGGTRAATARYLEQLIAEVPQPKWTVERIAADGDLVFLHARFSPAADAPEYAIADIFRLDGCKIVEHWDVVAAPPQEQSNPNSRF